MSLFAAAVRPGKLIAVSQATRNDMLHYYPVDPQRIEVIPHGVESQPDIPDAAGQLRARLGIAAEQRIVLFLSRWHPKKNIPLMLAALARLKHLPWVLVLAGTAEDAYADEVRRQVVGHSLQSRVHYPGHVQGPEKALLLQGADVLVMPSVSENFGVAAAEALASGLRTVVTRGVDLAPVVQNLQGGRVCDPDETALSEALSAELGEAHDKATLSQAAQAFFSWDRAATRLEKIYGELFA